MRSRLLVPVFAFALIGVVTSCGEDDISGIGEGFDQTATWVANLSGAQEVPANTSPATGRAWFIDNGTTITYYIEYSGLQANTSNAHIHRGAVGVSGGTVIQLPFVAGQTSGVVSGTINMQLADVGELETGTQSAAQIRASLDNEELYVNIHSSPQPPGFTGGEIRGQIRRR